MVSVFLISICWPSFSSNSFNFPVSNHSLLNIGGIPDIYLLLRGIRIIIELKEEGNTSQLIVQLQSRLSKNMCDLAVSLEYPTEIVSNVLALPTAIIVKKRLIEISFTLMILAPSKINSRILI